YSISGNTCTALLEDSQGRIWVSTEKDGLNLFDPRTQRFYHATPPIAANESIFIITFIKEDIAGNIWLITDNPEKVFFIAKKGFPTKPDFSKWFQKPDAYAKKKAQFKFDAHSIGVRFIKDFFWRENLVDTPKEEFKVLQDKQKRYWVFGQDKVICYAGQNAIKIIPFPSAGIPIANLLEDGSIAISNQQYLWVFKPEELLKTDQLNPRNALATMPILLKGIREVFKDKNENIWAGTYGYGLLKLNNNFKLFHSILPLYSPSHLLESSDGKLFMHGNYRPRYRFYEINATDNAITQIPVEINHPNYVQDALFQSKNGNYYLIHHILENKYMSCYSANWQLLKQYDITQYSNPFNYSHKFIEEKDGQLWIGLANGNILKLNPETEQFQYFSYQHVLPKNNSLTETFAFYKDDNQVFWIGTQKGLIKAENLTTKPKYTIFKNSQTDEQSLSNDFVSAIINDPYQAQRYLWVSTKGGGLERLDKQTGKFEHFTEDQGLPNRVVYGILPDEKNNLWLSTNRGLSRFNPKTLTFTNYNKSDGLQEDEFNTNSYYKGPSGKLYFGGINGISIVNPAAANDGKRAPVLKMIGLKINNRTIDVIT
ncbi:MAG TPA: two-component regulator propeller domain-containing protein, partial [Emticicia sp.]